MDNSDMLVRKALAADVSAMVAMVEERRLVYKNYEPVFWNKTENSAELSQFFFNFLIGKDATRVLVAEQSSVIVGFLIASETPAPPVFDPGGPTFTIDDYCVLRPELWQSVGDKLLDEALSLGREENWSQIVVVCPHKDRAKSQFLAKRELSLTTEWWTMAVSNSRPPGALRN